MHSLTWGFHGGFGRLPGWQGRRAGSGRRCRGSQGGDAATQQQGYLQRVKGWQGPLKAALTSGCLSAAGDLLAQRLTKQQQQPYEPRRTARMAGFGLCWYGPYQFYWYNLLEHLMPLKNTANFLAKVTLNQLALAPVTLAAVFAWNLSLTGQAAALPDKIRHDLVPNMINGWKFWVPAASLNFYAVPLQYQVLYMSCCGMLWTAYLSYISA